MQLGTQLIQEFTLGDDLPLLFNLSSQNEINPLFATFKT